MSSKYKWSGTESYGHTESNDLAEHRHELEGQTLVHSHDNGHRPHGYYEHAEDGYPEYGPHATVADAGLRVDPRVTRS